MPLRSFIVFLFFSAVMILHGCGSGSGSSDTAGSLTLSTPTSIDNKDGSYTVTTTVTYSPPAGKTAQGVVVTTTASDSFGNVSTKNATLTSGSNSVIYSFRVFQNIGFSSTLTIVSNIGGMSAGVSVVIPPITPLSASNVQFTSLEGSGITKTTTIAGGIEPYSLVSVSSSDLSVSLASKTLSVTNLTTGATVATAQIVLMDQTGSLLTVSVGYFKP